MAQPDTTPEAREARLDTWKDISRHLGVSKRTAQMWKETLGLPTHRIGGRVFAYARELDEWFLRQKDLPRTEAARIVPHAPVGEWSRSGRLGAVLGFLTLGVLLVAGGFFFLKRASPTVRPSIPEAVEARLFAGIGSERGTHREVPIPDPANLAAVSKDGKEIYLVMDTVPRLTIVDSASWNARRTELPTLVHEMRVSSDGRSVYLSSVTDGLLIYDRVEGKVTEHVRTGYPVSDVVRSPADGDLYVAMMHRGVWRLRAKDKAWERLTREGCPYFLDIDRDSQTLMVSYQCGGPLGREGHDSVELFDLRSQRSLGVVSGVPMVGGNDRFSPDGRTAWLSGLDACRTRSYDQLGCPGVGGIGYILDLATRRIAKTLAIDGSPQYFPNGNRVFVDGDMDVLETSQYRVLEHYKMNQIAAILAPDGRRIYALRTGEKALIVVDAEPEGCSLPGPGAIHLLTGDGTNQDSIENAQIPQSILFRPGFVGQAFDISSAREAVIESSASSRFGIGDSTTAMYVRPLGTGHFATLLEWQRKPGSDGWRLGLDAANHLQIELVQEGAKTISLTTKDSIPINAWSHIAATKTDGSITLFINGIANAAAPGFGMPWNGDRSTPYKLGWSAIPGSTFEGLVDEIAFWARALPAREIGSMYQRRLAGPCRL